MEREKHQVREYAALVTQPYTGDHQLSGSFQQARNVVPKFTSFKAQESKSLANADDDETGSKRPGNASSTSGTRRNQVDTLDRDAENTSSHHRRQHTSHRQHHKDKAVGTKSVQSGPVASESSPQTTDSGEFVIDRKGDPRNVNYGSLDRSAISNYRRSGAGSILGLVSRKIDRNSVNDKTISLTINGQFERSGRSALSKASKAPSEYLRVRAERLRDNGDRDASFLSFDTGRRKQKHDNTNEDSDSTSEHDAQHYRSVQGKAKAPDQPEDADLVYSRDASASEHEGREHGSDESTRSKRSELNRAVDNDPSNCENWVQLIGFQDEVGGPHRKSEEAKLTNAEKRSNAEIKLSMYEKAIAAVTLPKDKERLLMASMAEATRIWDAPKIQTKWKSILRDHPGSSGPWAKYLSFRATDFRSFKFDDVLAQYLDCLKILNDPSHPNAATGDLDAGKNFLYLVLRCTLLLREAGFTERATAIWQALLELHFFRPEKYQSSEASSGKAAAKSLLAFEEFWESEIPRVGEDGAQGWALYASEGGESAPSKTDENVEIGDGSDVYDLLVSAEQKRAMQARCPGRTIDDVVEDDPYRVILYSDVQDILQDFSNSKPSEASLILSLLAFCHLPPLQDAHSGLGARSEYSDPFLRGDFLGSSSASTSAWRLQPREGSANPTGAIDPAATNGPFSTPTADYATSTDTLFSATGSWFSLFEIWLLEYANDQGPVPIDWIRRTLKALVDKGIGGDALAEYFLALELRLSPEDVAKTAKRRLKAKPTSFHLYNAYVCINFRLGNPERATQILVAALNTSRDIAEPLQRDTIFLWQTWIWELLTSSREQEALERLISYPDRSLLVDPTNHTAVVSPDLNVTPTSLLRTQQALTASLSHYLSLSLPLHASTTSILLILLSYLSSSRSLPTAHATFTTHLTTLLTRFPRTSPAHELLHQSFARLLHYHATHIPLFEPAAIREALAASIALFPQNTIFLSLYAWTEARFRIDDRVRSIIRDVVFTSRSGSQPGEDIKQSMTPHLFALYSELSRSVTFGSNTNTIRNTFERAVDSSAGAHCAAIWKLYILFESRRGDKERAKAVWWRGVRACPWVKGLWMMAFGELRAEMRDEELRNVWEMMGEKELRLHVDLEGVLERRAGSQ